MKERRTLPAGYASTRKVPTALTFPLAELSDPKALALVKVTIRRASHTGRSCRLTVKRNQRPKSLSGAITLTAGTCKLPYRLRGGTSSNL